MPHGRCPVGSPGQRLTSFGTLEMKLLEELIIHAVLLVFMGVLYWESKSFPDLNIGGSLGASWWPQLTLGLGMILTVASAINVARRELKASGGTAKLKLVELKSLATSTAIFAVFLVAVDIVGFLFAAPLLMLGFVYQLGSRNPRMLILVPLLSSPLFAFIFGRFMEVPLPRGIGWARLISFYIY